MKLPLYALLLGFLASVSALGQTLAPKAEPKKVEVVKIDTKFTYKEARKKIETKAFASPLEEQFLLLQIHLYETDQWNKAHPSELKVTNVTLDKDGKLTFSTRSIQGIVGSLFGK